MKKHLIIQICALLLISGQVYAYNYLNVGDPRNSWYTDQGTIEEATLAIRPKGLFVEYGLYLTFSSRETEWTSESDTVEIVLNFELPEDAIIHDSWLYMKDYIAKAKIMDKWSASLIYEGIVNRRKDPSLLTKLSATQYELRVFPMAGNETRKVKITYLLPVEWHSKSISSKLPVGLLKSSKFNLQSLEVLTWANDDFINPVFSDPDIIFTPVNEPDLGDHYKASIPFSSLNSDLQLSFESSVENGIFLTMYNHKDNEGIYQLAIFPESILNPAEKKKVLVLVDFDAANSNLASSELLALIESELLNNLNETDSFNIMYSNLSIKSFSNNWENATEEKIKSAFASLNSSLSSYSNLSSLLVSGIEFIKTQGTNGKILLISNSDQYGNQSIANTLINDILDLMDPVIPIFISDYQSQNFEYNYINGRSYYGNEYFYSNLSRMTLGSIYRSWDGHTLSKILSESFKLIGGTINSFDLYTTVTNGYCYSRYNISGTNNIAYVNEPILQTGKFKGEFPFTMEITGEYNNQIFSKRLDLTEENASLSDSVAGKIWAGQYIKNLESANQSNAIIDEIVYTSTESRILSYYTAFICLENDDYVCIDCQDETNTTSLTEYSQSDTLKVYPNPFKETITIELLLTSGEEVISLSVVDISGKTIYTIDTSSLTAGRNYITCQPTGIDGSDLKPGFYILHYITNKRKYSLKIVKN